MVDKTKRGRLIRYSIFIGLPLLIAFLLFPPLRGGLSRYTDEISGDKKVIISKETIIPTTFQDYINSMLKISLDIQSYDVCFEDIGSHIEYYYKNDSIAKDFSTVDWNVNFNNLTNISLKSNSKSCISSVKSNESFVYYWEGTFGVILSSGSITNDIMTQDPKPAFRFVPNTISYYEPNGISWITFLFIIFVSVDSILYLFTRIAKIVKEGFLA